MNRKFISFAYAMNAVMQGLFSLLFPIALGVLGAWLLVTRCGVGEWIYAVLILFGALIGFYSMCKFLVRVSSLLEHVDKQSGESRR